MSRSTVVKVSVLLVVLSVVLAAVILISINFSKLSQLYSSKNNPDDDVINEAEPEADITVAAASMHSLPWRLNETQEEILAKQSKLMRSYINNSVNPCDDFYEFACGNWEKMNPIPKDKWQYSTIELLHHNLESELRELLSQPISMKQPLSATDKAKIYYKNCIDVEAIAKRGTEPLLEFIKELGGWPALDENWSESDFDWLQLAINSSLMGNDVIIAYNIEKSPQSPTEYTIFLKETTLGMSNRDNYLKEENSKNLEAYRNTIEAVLRLLNVDEQKARNVSEEIVNFEIQLANATLPPEATKTEPFLLPKVENLKKSYAYIDWQRYFSGVQRSEIDINQTLVIQLGVKYYENLYYVLAETENHTMANYMIWRNVLFVLLSLDARFRGAFNEFNSAITGQLEPIPVWRVCVTQINWNMGMATSAMFVTKYFDESSKKETINMINSLKESFDENLLKLNWIDSSTKAYASKKANAMKIAAGYPDFILSEKALNSLYEGLDMIPGKHFENSLNIVKYSRRRNRNRLFETFNEDHWFLPPTMVNALYDTASNRILILAGLLQPPVFHQHFPQSLNYGGMGMFMGHEIIHGFDDIGRKFDLHGNPLSWWSPDAILGFNERQKCFLEQYEHFSKYDKTFKSIATISENLADNGGLRLAYMAYLNWKKENAHTNMKKTLPDMELNDDQLFFLSFSQLFCAALRPEALIESRRYEAHSPKKYRVLGALVNFEKFSEVYKCAVGSPMNPSNKCRLW